jgi:hypothetical protein
MVIKSFKFALTFWRNLLSIFCLNYQWSENSWIPLHKWQAREYLREWLGFFHLQFFIDSIDIAQLVNFNSNPSTRFTQQKYVEKNKWKRKQIDKQTNGQTNELATILHF